MLSILIHNHQTHNLIISSPNRLFVCIIQIPTKYYLKLWYLNMLQYIPSKHILQTIPYISPPFAMNCGLKFVIFLQNDVKKKKLKITQINSSAYVWNMFTFCWFLTNVKCFYDISYAFNSIHRFDVFVVNLVIYISND